MNRVLGFFILMASLGVQARLGHFSYDEKQIRYMTPYDLFSSLGQAFANVDVNNKDCTSLTDKNRSFLGDNSPATGSPLSSEPSASFVRWYSVCLEEYTEAFSALANDDSREKIELVFGWSAYLWAVGHLPSPQHLASTLWTRLPASEKTALVLYHARRMIGPESILTRLGLLHSEAEFVELVLTALKDETGDLKSANKKIMMIVAARDEFLSY